MSSHAPDHQHASNLSATLAFINSEAIENGSVVDSLHSADDAIDLLVSSGMAHGDALGVQARSTGEAAWLERVRVVRAALRHVWDAQVEHHAPEPAALDVVNAILREAPRVELVPGEDCCGVGHRHPTHDPTGEALARLVEPFVVAVAAGGTDRFRICANDGCRWVFEDTSRAGRRRWCDMTSCGNVAKVRRYRARRRTAAGGAGTEGRRERSHRRGLTRRHGVGPRAQRGSAVGSIGHVERVSTEKPGAIRPSEWWPTVWGRTVTTWGVTGRGEGRRFSQDGESRPSHLGWSDKGKPGATRGRKATGLALAS